MVSSEFREGNIDGRCGFGVSCLWYLVVMIIVGIMSFVIRYSFFKYLRE